MSARVFCNAAGAVVGNELACAGFDKSPVTRWDLSARPWRHTANWFDASAEERAALLAMLDEERPRPDERFVADGVDIGETAGQTTVRLHVRLIPRYLGDTGDPRGGARGVIPELWHPSEGDEP